MLYRRNHITYRLLDTFFRNWWLIALAVVGVCAVVTAALLIRKPMYVATVSIRVISASDVSKALGVETGRGAPAKRKVDHLYDLMQNNLPGGFVDRTLKAARLAKPVNQNPEAQDPRFKQFLKGTFAKPDSRDVFTIGLTWDNADECERLVQELRDGFIEEAGLAQQVQDVATAQLMESEIAKYRKRVREKEEALIKYKTTHVGKLPQELVAQAAQLSDMRTERTYLNITSQDSQLRLQGLQQRMARIKPVSIMEQTFTTDPDVKTLRDYQAQRGALLADKWLPTSTQVRELDKLILALRQKIEMKKKADPGDARNVVETKLQENPEYQRLSEQIAEANIQQTTQQKRAALLDQQIATLESRLRALPAEERMLTELTRDYDIVQAKLIDLLGRREQAETKARVNKVTATSTMVVQTPIFAQSTTSASKKIIMMIGGLIVGLVVGLLAVVAREWMDSSLRYGTDASRLLGVPVLACLPDNPDLSFPAPQRRGVAGLLPGGQRQLGSAGANQS